MTLKEIIATWLRENDYDGLCRKTTEDFDCCDCGLDNLFPCECPEWNEDTYWPDCEAAYRYKNGGFGPDKNARL